MVFKKLLNTLGMGGPVVDTVLSTAQAQPGGELTGEVRLRGGDHPVEITEVRVALVAEVRVERQVYESADTRLITEIPVARGFTLAPGQELAFPVRLPIPLETPLTHAFGRPLPGIAVGVQTRLKVAKALGAGDLDPVEISPLAGQQRVLDAVANLGFRPKDTAVEPGRIGGPAQRLPFHQEIAFWPPSGYTALFDELAVALVTTPNGLIVGLEPGRHSLARPMDDGFGRFSVTVDHIMQTNWEHEFTAWLQAVVTRLQPGHPAQGYAGQGYADQPYPGHPGSGYAGPGYGPGYAGSGYPGSGYGPGYADSGYGPGYAGSGYAGSRYGGRYGGRRGPGWGGVAAAGLGGLAAGMFAGEAVELAGDAIGGAAHLAGDAIAGTADLAGDAIAGTAGLAGDAIAGTAGLAGDAIGGTADLAGDVIGGGANLVGDGFGAVGDVIGGGADLVGDGFGVAGEVAEGGFDLLGDGFDAMGDGLGDLFG